MKRKTLKVRIAVLGDGGWGTTLALLLAHKGYRVSVWGAFADYINQVKRTRINSKFLPGIRIPPEIELTADLAGAVQDKDIIILAIPSQFIRGVLAKISGLEFSRSTVFLSVTKGIETRTLKRVSEIIHEEVGDVATAVLSGPTIAQEVAKGIPTTAVVASSRKEIRTYLQDILITDRFRIYTNDDVIGVELGGSLKNVIAIACGISDGLGFGTNTKAALLSRGLSEISRLGYAMGAKIRTFSGISGLGDLVTTCISPLSRNRSVGEQIGKGVSLRTILSSMTMVAEGIPTTESAYKLSRAYTVDTPLIQEVYRVLYHNKSAHKAVEDLMTRKRKEE